MRLESRNLHLVLLTSITLLSIWSIINPKDMLTWFLEALPFIIVLMILIPTYKQFRLTNLSYILLWAHSIILLIGAHYTYADMPLFDWIQAKLDLSRNHYDRLGHIFQGFVPAIIIRELLLRTSPLRPGKWLFTIVVLMVGGISAAYELFEWIAAEISASDTVAFLATQGDVWDTQKDMALAFLGASVALFTLSKYHSKAINKIAPETIKG